MQTLDMHALASACVTTPLHNIKYANAPFIFLGQLLDYSNGRMAYPKKVYANFLEFDGIQISCLWVRKSIRSFTNWK